MTEEKWVCHRCKQTLDHQPPVILFGWDDGLGENCECERCTNLIFNRGKR